MARNASTPQNIPPSARVKHVVREGGVWNLWKTQEENRYINSTYIIVKLFYNIFTIISFIHYPNNPFLFIYIVADSLTMEEARQVERARREKALREVCITLLFFSILFFSIHDITHRCFAVSLLSSIKTSLFFSLTSPRCQLNVYIFSHRSALSNCYLHVNFSTCRNVFTL
jgi:hypothetical protein